MKLVGSTSVFEELWSKMGNTKSAANVPPHMEFVLRRKRVSGAKN